MGTPQEDPQHPGEVIWTDATGPTEPDPYPPNAGDKD